MEEEVAVAAEELRLRLEQEHEKEEMETMVGEEKLAWALRLKKTWAAGAAAIAFIAASAAELIVAKADAKGEKMLEQHLWHNSFA